MSFTHKGKRALLIWDGTDVGIINKCYEVCCPYCRAIIKYDLRDIKNLNELNSGLQQYPIDVGIVSDSDVGYIVKKGIPAYVIPSHCANCRKDISLIVGLKEVQPQRYNAFFKSAVVELNESVR